MAVLEHIKTMTPERFLALYTSLERDGFGPMDGEVARSLHYRPQAIRKLSMEQRAKRARTLIETGRNAEIAYEILGGYLMKTRKELVTSFLDATGVKHEDGMIEDIDGSKPAAAKIAAAVSELDAKFPKEDVTLYLVLAAEQWPGEQALEKLVRERT